MDELFKAGRTVTYKKGEVLIRPSDTGGELFVITKGLVHNYTIEESGEKNIIVIYGPGEVFPLAWIVKKKALNIFYEAVTDCEVVKIPGETAVRLLQTDVTASFDMLTQVVKQFVAYKARVDNLEYKYARERIAYWLLVLGGRIGENTGDGILVLPRFNQEEIGSMTNVSRESVGREMKRFERLGFIEYAPGKLKILSMAGLRAEIVPADAPLFIDDLN